jgi:hypothetical protein
MCFVQAVYKPNYFCCYNLRCKLYEWLLNFVIRSETIEMKAFYFSNVFINNCKLTALASILNNLTKLNTHSNIQIGICSFSSTFVCKAPGILVDYSMSIYLK